MPALEIVPADQAGGLELGQHAIHSCEPDVFAGIDAIAVLAILDATQRLVDLRDQLAVAVAGAQFQRVLGLAGGTLGLVAAFDIKPVEGKPGLRAYKAMENAFHEFGTMVRITADTIALSPPLMITENQIDELMNDKMPKILASVA